MRSPVNLALVLVASVGSLLILRRSLHGLDVNWDTYAYHLPFAARLAGLCDRSCYELVPWHEARFDGFPMLASWLQAAIWRATGSPDWTDLINTLALGMLVVAARVKLRTSAALFLTALLAVPVIQIQLSVTYIDVFANALVALAFVLLIDAFLDKDAAPWRVALVLAPVAAAVNSKFQMLPIGALVSLAATVLLVVRLRRGAASDVAIAAGAYVVLALLVLATCIGNVIAYGNPVYPVAVPSLGIPGHDQVSTVSLSQVWANTPRPLVWLASVFEVEAYASRPWAWNVGQGHVDVAAPSFRMGGYFGVYVLANLVLFIHVIRNTVKPVALAGAGFFVAATLLTAVLPASHELRYYIYWMMLLLLLNCVFVSRPDVARSVPLQTAHRQVFSWTVLVSFAAGAAITGGRYFSTADTLPISVQLEAFGANQRVGELFADHKLNCMGVALVPFRFLYAPIFHPGREYQVREIEPGLSAEGCQVVIP